MSAQQIHGTITDDETGDSIAFASVVYKGHNIAAISDINGQYKIGRHEGWNITFSAVGYKTRIIPVTNKTKARLNIKLKPDKQMLAEVTVKAKRGRYSRKNNPAVELMKRVVAAKKLTDLGIPQTAVPGMAKAAMQVQRLLKNNPREVTEQDALEIYNSLY
jgi:hypothetical protein